MSHDGYVWRDDDQRASQLETIERPQSEAHFNDHRGERWEAWRDAGTDQSDWLFDPPPLAAE